MATVLRNYPGYRLEHIYSLPVKAGGITLPQLNILHASADKQLLSDLKFQAVIHGIDLESDQNNKQKVDGVLLFRDPKDYEKMSENDRDREQKKMAAKWQGFGFSDVPRQSNR